MCLIGGKTSRTNDETINDALYTYAYFAVNCVAFARLTFGREETRTGWGTESTRKG